MVKWKQESQRKLYNWLWKYFIGEDTNSDFYLQRQVTKEKRFYFINEKFFFINIVIIHYIVHDDICLMVRKINYFILLFLFIIVHV